MLSEIMRSYVMFGCLHIFYMFLVSFQCFDHCDILSVTFSRKKV